MHRKITATVLAVFLQSSIAFGWNEPEEFRGIKWGTSIKEALSIVDGEMQRRHDAKDTPFTIWAPENITESMFTWKTVVGHAPVTMLFFFYNGGFSQVSLSFSSTSSEYMRDAFKEKYGAPTSEKTVEVQNRTGAKFQNVQTRWIGEKVFISLDRYGSSLDKGYATIQTKEYFLFQEEARKKTKTGADKDL